MPVRRPKAKLTAVKLHYSYSSSELAACCGVHKNTVRNWQRDGLEPNDEARPVLFPRGHRSRLPEPPQGQPQAPLPTRHALLPALS